MENNSKIEIGAIIVTDQTEITVLLRFNFIPGKHNYNGYKTHEMTF